MSILIDKDKLIEDLVEDIEIDGANFGRIKDIINSQPEIQLTEKEKMVRFFTASDKGIDCQGR